MFLIRNLADEFWFGTSNASAEASSALIWDIRWKFQFGNSAEVISSATGESDQSAESDASLGILPRITEGIAMQQRAEVSEAGRPYAKHHERLSVGSFDLHASEELHSLLHDARNMIAALDLYCDLLDEPGVLVSEFRHYAPELRFVAGTSRRLLEKLAALDHAAKLTAERAAWALAPAPPIDGKEDWLLRLPVSQPVANLAEAMLANQSLLSALAGPAVKVSLTLSGGHAPVGMTGDDLTRILVNLTRNAVEAMPGGGRIEISLEEFRDRLLLTFADNGFGIPVSALKTIFTPGYSTHLKSGLKGRRNSDSASHCNVIATEVQPSNAEAFHASHRGLGLTIVHSLVSAAGGSIRAENLPVSDLSDSLKLNEASHTFAEEKSGGACFVLEFPLEPPLHS